MPIQDGDRKKQQQSDDVDMQSGRSQEKQQPGDIRDDSLMVIRDNSRLMVIRRNSIRVRRSSSKS